MKRACFIAALMILVVFSVCDVFATNMTPVPVISGPSVVEAGKPYTFSAASSYDPDGQIVLYSWFASGATPLTSSQISLDFTWQLSGTKNIYLWVTDNAGKKKEGYKTITIVDARQNITGVSASLSPQPVRVGSTSVLSVTGYPAGSSVSFADEGGYGSVSISQNGNMAYIYGIATGYKKMSYTVSNPAYSAYKGYVEFVVEGDGLLTMQNIGWYMTAPRLEKDGEADFFVTGAPAGSSYSFSYNAGQALQIREISGNRVRLKFLDSGDMSISCVVSCPGYRNYTVYISFRVLAPEKPVAAITAPLRGYTGETYVFSSENSTQGADAWEWKWHSITNTVTASTGSAFTKTWSASQYGTYILWLRVRKGAVWSDWTSKTVEILQGISFDPDSIYSGNKTIKDSEWEYVRTKLGPIYEKYYTINGRQYLFNVEIFQDRGLVVYGDYTLDSVQSNTFSQGSEATPYFVLNGVQGEYKYLGFVYGTLTPFTNQNYKAAHMLILEGTGKNASLLPFSGLPQSVKDSWGISGAGNQSFASLSDEINGEAGMQFSNGNASNRPSPLYMSSVFGYDSAAYDPFGYGIVNFFDKHLGGSVRLFFRYFSGGYDWRTFEGVIASEKQCPDILLTDDMPRELDFDPGTESVLITAKISMKISDMRLTNILLKRNAFYYDRTDPHAHNLTISPKRTVSGLAISEVPPVYEDDQFTYSRQVTFRINKEMLVNGINEFVFTLAGGISFSPAAERDSTYDVTLRVSYNPGRLPLVETLDAVNITANSARLRYSISDPGEPAAAGFGVEIRSGGNWQKIHDTGAVSGARSVEALQLTSNTYYTYRAYAIQGTETFYGQEKNFSTPLLTRPAPSAPVVTEITSSSARITSDPGSYVVCNGEEKLTGSIFYGLSESTTYETYAYFRPEGDFARSADSAKTEFTTLAVPYSLPDRYIYVGETITVSDCDHLEFTGSSPVAVTGKDILGTDEGSAVIRAVKGTKSCYFTVQVFPLPEEVGNAVEDFRLTRVYDPDFNGLLLVPYGELPVYEHINGGMIDLGYAISCEAEFAKEESLLPQIHLFGADGYEYHAYRLVNGNYVRYEPSAAKLAYNGTILSFDLYIYPDAKFFKTGINPGPSSVQTVKEVLVCVDFGIPILAESENLTGMIVRKRINSEMLQVFWYNLRRNCYDDLGYEKGW